MERDGRHIGASIHSGQRLTFEFKVEMGAMGFVNEDGHVMGVSIFDKFFQITNRAKVSWVDNKDGFGGCVSIDGSFPIIESWLIGNLKIVVNLRHDINRNGA